MVFSVISGYGRMRPSERFDKDADRPSLVPAVFIRLASGDTADPTLLCYLE
jgi:hypothetical protein